MAKHILPTFESEKALCQAFIASVPDEWIVYPETAGFDILLVHREGAWQIGIEAKKTLNAKVLAQAIKGLRYERGPDFRAVLVGKVVAENAVLAHALGLTVIVPKPAPSQDFGGYLNRYVKLGPYVPEFAPDLPQSEHLEKIGSWWSEWDREKWFDQYPTKRVDLPDYIPDVQAGVPSPILLSDWKIKAMRVCVWVRKHQTITRHIFRKLGLNPSLWMNGAWLEPTGQRGVWKAGPSFPADRMRNEHPDIFAKIEADYSVWSEKVLGAK